LPRLPGGKVDRRALPEPQAAVAVERTPPRTPTEEALAAIWVELLNPPDCIIGVHDNFFDLGGHSLAAARLAARAAETFGVALTAADLFAAPTVAELAERIVGRPQAALEPIDRAPEPERESAPLSFSQQRLWFLDQLQPGKAAYNMPAAFRLNGPLDAGALEAALGVVARDQESLGARFASQEGRPVQRIAPPSAVVLPLIDLSSLPPADREAVLTGLIARDARAAFDLERGPLWRAAALRIETHEHALLFNFSHLISDGWSVDLLTRLLAEAYRAELAGGLAPAAAPEIQYQDYARWQRRAWEAGRFDDQLVFWREALAGAPHVIDLPLDRPRPETQSLRGDAVTFEIDAELTGRLRALSRENGATLFMTLHAAFAALLSRYGAGEDIVIGTAAANRGKVRLERLIGFFANTLPLRLDLSGAPAFRALLGRARQAALGAFAHQDLPFEKLIDALGVRRHPGRPPLCQVVFAMTPPRTPAPLPGLTLEPIPHHNGSAKFELTLLMAETPGGLAGLLEFSEDIFDRAAAARLADHFQRLLAGFASEPDAPIDAISLLSAEERAALISTDFRDHRQKQCLHQHVESWAARTPDAVAVRCGGREWTYAELNRRANRLARRLIQLGIGPEARVGLLAPRSIELTAGLLAALKAGAAYVPLDPAYPDTRLAWLARDAGLAALLTAPGLDAAWVELNAPRIALDAGVAETGDDPNPSSRAVPANAAYLIYTSGSTGAPKGVMATHANVGRLFEAASAHFRFGADDVWSVFHSFAFDFSVWELWGAWLHGGRAAIADAATVRDPDLFQRFLADEGVTGLSQTPTAFAQLARAQMARGERPAWRVRWVVFGGEALDWAALADWRAWLGGAAPQLINMYGITETTVHVTFADAAALDRAPGAIGVPLDDLCLYVVDRRMRLVPIGAPGEICVGGAGLTRGYHDRPELTATRFVPDPFAPPDRPGARLYKSGDLARRRGDGALIYLGRGDRQVKLRGFRIELGEIEAALRGLDGVAEAAVVLRERDGRPRLLGYVEPAGEPPDPAALRAALARRLPEHLLPAALISVTSWPLTPNGKLDRAALPEPAVETAVETTPTPPRSQAESALLAVWRELLRRPTLDIHDNFFEQGGDSIMAIEAVDRARKAGLHVTPLQLFQRPTVAELAAVAVDESARQAGPPPDGATPLTPIQRWFFAGRPANPHHDNQAVLLRLAAEVDPERLERAVRLAFEHHHLLRLRYEVAEDGAVRQTYGGNADFPFERIVADPSRDRSARLFFEREAAARQRELNIESGPLARGAYLRHGDEARLLLIAHHLTVDAVSWRILLDDARAAYGALSGGGTPELPPIGDHFQTHAHTLAQRIADGAFADELAHWGACAAADAARLAADRPDAALPPLKALQTRTATLDQDQLETLQTNLRQMDAGLEEALLTALVRAFQSLTSVQALNLDLESHGRDGLGLDLSRAVGWFTALFPISLEAALKDDAHTVLKAVRAQRRAVPNGGIGFGALLASDDPTIREPLAARPTSALRFNYLGRLDPTAGAEALFAPAPEFAGPTRDPAAPARYPLDVTAYALEGRLIWEWRYSPDHFDDATVDRLADDALTALRALATDAYAAPAPDLDQAGLDQDDLELLLEDL